jgi:DNA-binding winged helix-turn-helix (wHTH) protein/TolB-like protein/tetratricopeptide (TPR) repeat protein
MTSTGNPLETNVYVFDRFRLELTKRLLRTDQGETIPLVPKAFDTLAYLVTNHGRLIGKDELMSAIWPDTIVEENNLNKNISILRRVLGDDLRNHRFIVTVPGQGFKFVAKVESEIESSRTLDEVATERPRFTRRFPARLTAAVIGASIIAVAAFFWIGRDSGKGAARGATIAVLPFRPLVAEHRDEALELGMADAVISSLSQNRALVVRPLTSVRGFSGLDQDAIGAGLALGVDYIVDGTIQRWGDKIRVTVRLAAVNDGSVLWTEAFDERFTDIFVVQDTISKRATAALSPHFKLPGEPNRSVPHPDAYAFYLRGRFHVFKLTEGDMRKAIGFYEMAILTDPNYALAYAGMADAYRTLASAGYAPGNEVCPKARELAERALAIDGSLAEAHIVLGWVALLYSWDWVTAERELQKAIELSPNDSEAHRAYAHLLSNSGRHEEAVREGRLARELAPLTLITAALESQFLKYAGRDTEALERATRTLELDPDFWVTHNIIGRIYLNQNRLPEAVAEFRRAVDLSGGSPEPLGQLGYAYAVSNDIEKAREVIDRLENLSKERFVPAYSFALVYNGLGETEASLDELWRSFSRREVQLVFITVDPRWDKFRNEKRFVDLVTEMGVSNK